MMVSGRTYPVEQRWRPFEESRDHGLNEAIADGVDELWAGAGGDILVFLPGEREIREAADHLRKHLAAHPVLRSAEVLPLFARLSQAEQDRVFDAHHGRRIVLATNVAETSLTVPGIRYVIDAGTARVKRYSYRSKVEQLLIEPSARRRPTSAPAAAAAWPTASASACTTRRTLPAARASPTRKSCAPRWPA
jgi:ATP-dependent helicase HrpA